MIRGMWKYVDAPVDVVRRKRVGYPTYYNAPRLHTLLGLAVAGMALAVDRCCTCSWVFGIN